MDVYFFDCDQTLYAYDFHQRLPMLARLTGVSQYHLASTWWAAGHEYAAESGEYATTEEYLRAFRTVTGAELTLDIWFRARKAAMTPIPEAIAALRRASSLGTAALLSNNPIPFRDSIEELIPEAWPMVNGSAFLSAELGARKPDPLIYVNALARVGAEPKDAILLDDSAANVDGARRAGMHGYQVHTSAGVFDSAGLDAAIAAFAARER